MIKIEETKDSEIVTKILSDNTLFHASMDDEDIRQFEQGVWQPSFQGWRYLHIMVDGKDAAIVRWHYFTPITIGVHWHLLPKFWGTGISDEINKEVDAWFEENTQALKLTTQVPYCLENIWRAVVRGGFRPDGIMAKATIWRDQIEDVVILSKFLNREYNG